MAKTKMTGFSRMLLFLIIFLPLAFAGASYINGEDPIQKAKEVLGMDGNASQQTSSSSREQRSKSGEVTDLEVKILQLERDLAIAEEKLARCQLEKEQNQ